MPEKTALSHQIPPGAIGITSTIPIEVPLAAGQRVVDLNNVFVRATDPAGFLRRAEGDGFPRNCCSWIRGLYGLIRTSGLDRVIFVTGGDCSNTQAMMETLLPSVRQVITFSFPYPPAPEPLRREIDRFCGELGTTFAAAEETGRSLQGIRDRLAELDRLTWQDRRVTGFENHLWLVSSSDFGSDPTDFGTRLDAFLEEARQRRPLPAGPRIGILGVPPIMTDLHDFIEGQGVAVVYNEIARQFSLPGRPGDLVERYLEYTYPYGVWPRVDDIRAQVERRGVHGLIHYTQAFCHRQIHDLVFRQALALPILTIEGEGPGPADPRTRLRIESFLEIIKEKAG